MPEDKEPTQSKSDRKKRFAPNYEEEAAFFKVLDPKEVKPKQNPDAEAK